MCIARNCFLILTIFSITDGNTAIRRKDLNEDGNRNARDYSQEAYEGGGRNDDGARQGGDENNDGDGEERNKDETPVMNFRKEKKSTTPMQVNLDQLVEKVRERLLSDVHAVKNKLKQKNAKIINPPAGPQRNAKIINPSAGPQRKGKQKKPPAKTDVENHDLYEKTSLQKGKKDSYEDYATPKKDADAMVSGEEGPGPPVATTKALVKKKTPYVEREYDDDTNPPTPPVVKVRTENMGADDYEDLSAESKAKMEANLATGSAASKIVTNMQTRTKFSFSSPNYYAKLPRQAEKYNFNEPIPEKDRNEERIKDILPADVLINKKMQVNPSATKATTSEAQAQRDQDRPIGRERIADKPDHHFARHDDKSSRTVRYENDHRSPHDGDENSQPVDENKHIRHDRDETQSAQDDKVGRDSIRHDRDKGYHSHDDRKGSRYNEETRGSAHYEEKGRDSERKERENVDRYDDENIGRNAERKEYTEDEKGRDSGEARHVNKNIAPYANEDDESARHDREANTGHYTRDENRDRNENTREEITHHSVQRDEANSRYSAGQRDRPNYNDDDRYARDSQSNRHYKKPDRIDSEETVSERKRFSKRDRSFRHMGNARAMDFDNFYATTIPYKNKTSLVDNTNKTTVAFENSSVLTLATNTNITTVLFENSTSSVDKSVNTTTVR